MKGDEFGSGKSTNSPLLKALVNFLKSPNIGNAQTFDQTPKRTPEMLAQAR